MTLNNTVSIRPKAYEGSVVPSITVANTLVSLGSSPAHPLWQCTLRLPNSFPAGDQQEFVVMAKLFMKEPGNVVLRPWHWLVSPTVLLKGLAMITNHGGGVVVHQPLAMCTHESARRCDISKDQDMEPPWRRRRGVSQDYIVVEDDGQDYIEHVSALQTFAKSFVLTRSESALQIVASPETSPFGIWF